MSTRLLVGLGNPGNQYQDHRHNFGFMLLDALAQEHSVSWQKKQGAFIAEIFVPIARASHKVFLLKPQEFMNCSGRATGNISRYYQIASEDILAVYDELDLPLGKVRHRLGGGAGGHNGVRDLIRHLPEDFHRLRLGIGHPGDKKMVHHYVLSNFAKHEQELQQQIIEESVRYVDLLIEKNFAEFMNRLTHLLPKAEIEKD